MTQTVTVTQHIGRPLDEVVPFVTDPHRLIPVVGKYGRCQHVGDSTDGDLWDVYLVSGTIPVGGRVRVTEVEGTGLSWQSLRGTRHSFETLVDDAGCGTRMTMRLSFSLAGFGIAWITELIGRGIAGRYLEAAAEELRHHLEFEL